MKNSDQTIGQFLKEIDLLKAKMAKLEKSEIEHKQTEKALRESEEKFREMANLLPQIVYETDIRGNLTFVNKQAFAYFGYTKKDYDKGIDAFQMLIPEDIDKAKENIQNILNGKAVGNPEYTALKKDGTTFPVLIYSSCILKDNKPIGVRGIIIDITERKQAKELLRIERDNLNNIFNAMEDGVYIVNQLYDIQYVNPVLIKDFGIYEGRKCYEYFNDRTEVCPWCKNPDVFSGKTVRWEWYSFKNQRTYDLIDTPLKNPDGSISKLEIFRDITERKQAEKSLKESEHNYRILFDNLSDGIFVLDAETQKIVLANKAIAKMYGFESEVDTVNINPIDFILPEYKEEVYKIIIDDMFKKDLHQINEFRSITKDGREIWISAVGVKTEYKGRLAGLISIRDITKRKRAEIELLRSEEQFRNFAENVPGVVSIYEWYPDGHRKVIYQGPGLTNIIGKKLADKVKKNPDEYFKLIHPKDLEALEKASINAIKTNKNLDFEYRLQLEDLSYKWILSRFSMFPKANGVIRWQGIIYNITERKQAEEALKATNEKLTMLAQTVTSMKEYVSITNIDGKIIFINQAFLDKYGYKRDEILGKPSEILHSPHNPKVMRKRIHAGTLKGGWRGELLNQTKDGKEFPVELLTSILKDENGKNIALIGIAVDITERKQAEQIQSVLYKIADAINTTKDLDELYHTIHQHLSTVIDTTNIYIALYDEDKNIISFPYYIDEKDPIPEPVPKKLSKGLTGYVIRTGKSLLAPKEYYLKLAKEGKIEISGSISEVWFGIPLRIEKKIIGVMAVQSYKDASIYNEKDVEILELVSYQIAIAIERKQAEEALKKKNIELETFNRLAIGREMRIIELKKDINGLLEKLGEEPKYNIVE